MTQLVADDKYEMVPNRLGACFKTYIEYGIPLGGFLTAVVENDLCQACSRADMYNQPLLFNIVSWLYNYAPAHCWGSREKVAKWLASHNERRTPHALHVRQSG